MLEQLARVSAIFQQLENQPPNLSLLQAASKLYDSLHQILFNTTKARGKDRYFEFDCLLIWNVLEKYSKERRGNSKESLVP